MRDAVFAEALAPFAAWADRFDPAHNENIPSEDPVGDDFELANVLAPDGITVGDLRRLKTIFESLCSRA